MFPELWELMKESSLMFNFDTKKFIYQDVINMVKQKTAKSQNRWMNCELYIKRVPFRVCHKNRLFSFIIIHG